MKRKRLASGFSLVEVAFSIGLIAFSMVAMLGLLPLGLGEGLASLNETRGTHLAQAVFAELKTPPFEAANCFGTRLNLAALDDADAPVILHASFPADQPPEITSSAAGTGMTHTIALRFHKMEGANRVTLTVAPRNQPESGVQFASIIGNY